MNVIGKRFGRLSVETADISRPGYVICRCDCGRKKSVRATSLTKTKQPTRSCGCIQREIARGVGTQTVRANASGWLSDNAKFDTNFHVIESPDPPKNNKTGCKGVWFDKSNGLYVSYINVHHKRRYLGRYRRFSDAVNARKAAEQELFDPLIAAKNGVSP